MIGADGPRTPVTVVTGPHQAGKATLFAHLARNTAMAGSVVLTTGRSGLVADRPPEGEAPIRPGCVCCTVQGDLQRSLRALLPQARRGDVSHVLVDADPRSDPMDLLTTLITDPVLAAVYRIGGVIAVVGEADHDPAAQRLIQLADRAIVLRGGMAAAAVRGLNPAARVTEGLPEARFVLEEDRFVSVTAPTDTIAAVTLHDPIDWSDLARRLGASVLRASSGGGVQRLFGVLQIAGESRPVAIDAVRHHLAPPHLLSAWPSGDTPQSRLVFLGSNLDAASIEAALARPVMALPEIPSRPCEE